MSATQINIRGLLVRFDHADAALVLQHRWWLKSADRRDVKFYAFTTVGRQTIYMHRLVLSAPKGLMIDHADGDTLNNQRANLRICNATLNNANKRGFISASGFRGVYAERRAGAFTASISVGGYRTRLGVFECAEDAARAYDAAALKAFGDFATLNFPIAEVRAA